MIEKEGTNSPEIRAVLHIIHTERVNTYRQRLQASHSLEGDIRALLDTMIEESNSFLASLANGDDLPQDSDLHRIWKGTKAPGDSNDKKTMAKTCAEDELTLINFYSLVLSSLQNDPVLEDLLQAHQRQLLLNYHHMEQFYHAL